MREKLGGKSLEEDEAQEEDYEYVEISKIYGHDDLKGKISLKKLNSLDQHYLDSINYDKAFTEYLGIVNTLQTDVTTNLIRCEIKAGKLSHKLSKHKTTDLYTTILKNPQGVETLPERLKARMNIMQSTTTLKIKKDATDLQHTLQTAGKLEPPKPKVQFYEEELIQEGGNNSYFNALLYMTMAGCKSKYPEQKYLLHESMSISFKIPYNPLRIHQASRRRRKASYQERSRKCRLPLLDSPR